MGALRVDSIWQVGSLLPEAGQDSGAQFYGEGSGGDQSLVRCHQGAMDTGADCATRGRGPALCGDHSSRDGERSP